MSARLSMAAETAEELGGGLEPFSAPFCGALLTVRQRPIATSSAGSHCPTGCLIWPASLALLRLLEALPPRALEGASCIDLSPGTGLTTLALAQLCGAGGRVLALELPQALPLLAANLAAGAGAAAAAACCAAPYHWGQPEGALPLGALAGAPPLALALACDVLYCAVRDGLAAELAGALAALAAGARHGVLVVWQPRRAAEEGALLAAAAAARPGLVCSAPARLAAGAGAGLHAGVGHPAGEIWLPPSLFPEAEEEEGGVLYAVLRQRSAPELPLAEAAAAAAAAAGR